MRQFDASADALVSCNTIIPFLHGLIHCGHLLLCAFHSFLLLFSCLPSMLHASQFMAQRLPPPSWLLALLLLLIPLATINNFFVRTHTTQRNAVAQRGKGEAKGRES